MSNLGKIELIISNWDQIFHFHFRYCCPQKNKTGHFSSKVCEMYNNKKNSSKTLFFNVRVRCRLVAILLPSSSWLLNKHPNGNKNNGFLKVFHCHDKPPKAVSKISLYFQPLFNETEKNMQICRNLLPSSSWLLKHPNENKNNGFFRLFHCHGKLLSLHPFSGA